MADRSVGITELRDHLSEYLRSVRRGHPVTVVDRGEPVAQLVPLPRKGVDLTIRRAIRDVRSVKLPPANWKRIDVDKLLDDVRADRV